MAASRKTHPPQVAFSSLHWWRTISFLASTPLLSAADADWPAYLGGEDRNHYSTLTQIHPANVHTLRPAWTYRAGEVGTNP